MGAKIVKNEDGKLVIEMDMELKGSFLFMEEQIQVMVNEVGKLATQAALEKFDTNGEDIVYKKEKYTSKGQFKKK